MSGFAAILSFDATVTAGDVERLCAPAACRGPDGISVWTSGQIGLGHLSRRTLPGRDLTAQPLVSGELAIVFDGRIDNRDDLSARLGVLHGDAAIALAAYRRWGSETAREIIGDFAMVVWDRERRSLYCARDPLGIEPFYYHWSPHAFVAGSDIAQVLAAPDVVRAPNEGMIGEYLSNSIVDRHETVYAGIFRLPAGHSLEVVRGGVAPVPRPYWRIDPHRAIHYRTDDEYAEHFRSIFLTAVGDRLRSASPVGVYFSGGTDSSAVMAAACAVAPGSRPAGFTLAFDRPEQDEQVYVDDLTRHCGFQSHVEPAALPGWTPSTGGRDVHDFLRDRPADRWKRSIAARGYRVMLSGHGGDAGFYGSEYHYADLLKAGRIVALARQIRDDRRLPDNEWRPAKLVAYGLWPLLPPFVIDVLRPLARRSIGYRVTRPWLEPAYAARIDLEARLRPPARDRRGPSASRDDLIRDVESGWNAIYRENAERDSEEQGLEDRHPFFDRRVIEFAAALPDDQRWRGQITRYVVRRGLGDLLSPAALTRSTRAEGAARVADAVAAMHAIGTFDRMSLTDMGWIRPDVLREMFNRMTQHYARNDLAYADDAFPLWIIGGTELWFRQTFVRGYNRG